MGRLIDLMRVVDGLSLLEGAGTQAFPPSTLGVVPAAPPWTNYDGGAVISSFDVELWSGSDTVAGLAVAVTNAELFAGVLRQFTIASQNITSVDATTNVITKNTHGLLTGDGPLQLTGTLPPPVLALENVYAIKTGANTFKLAASRADAMAGIPIDLTGTGSGTIAIAGVLPNVNPLEPLGTQRLYWTSLGLLGNAGDGVVALDTAKGYRKTFEHRSRSYCYGLVATIDQGILSAALYPILARS